jgi:hypothetical protein
MPAMPAVRRLVLAAAASAALTGLAATPALASGHHGHRVPAAAAAIEGHHIRAAAPATTYHICLLNDSSKCWHWNGIGTQVTIVGSGSASSVAILNGGGGTIEFQNAGGKCVYAGDTGNALIEAGGACSGGAEERWYNSGTNPYAIESYAFPDQDTMVFNNVSGKPVWLNPIGINGGWYSWGQF